MHIQYKTQRQTHSYFEEAYYLSRADTTPSTLPRVWSKWLSAFTKWLILRAWWQYQWKRPSKQCELCFFLHDKYFQHSGFPECFSWWGWSVGQIGQVGGLGGPGGPGGPGCQDGPVRQGAPSYWLFGNHCVTRPKLWPNSKPKLCFPILTFLSLQPRLFSEAKLSEIDNKTVVPGPNFPKLRL